MATFKGLLFALVLRWSLFSGLLWSLSLYSLLSLSFICFLNNLLQVYGLDINPRAVKVSWINLYLNALDENGQPIYDSEKKTLLDRVEFYESDLLAYCRDRDIQLERIVGCIPQVLLQCLSRGIIKDTGLITVI